MSDSYLDELSVAGECAVEYLGLYQKLIKPTHWKVYLAARGVLPYIGNLITKVIALKLNSVGEKGQIIEFIFDSLFRKSPICLLWRRQP